MTTRQSAKPSAAQRTRKLEKALKLALPILRESRDGWIGSYCESDASGKEDPATITDRAVLRDIRKINRVLELAAELGIQESKR